MRQIEGHDFIFSFLLPTAELGQAKGGVGWGGAFRCHDLIMTLHVCGAERSVCQARRAGAGHARGRVRCPSTTRQQESSAMAVTGSGWRACGPWAVGEEGAERVGDVEQWVLD